MFHKENWAGLERWLQAATTAYTPALGDLTPSLAVTSTSTSFHIATDTTHKLEIK